MCAAWCVLSFSHGFYTASVLCKAEYHRTQKKVNPQLFGSVFWGKGQVSYDFLPTCCLHCKYQPAGNVPFTAPKQISSAPWHSGINNRFHFYLPIVQFHYLENQRALTTAWLIPVSRNKLRSLDSKENKKNPKTKYQIPPSVQNDHIESNLIFYSCPISNSGRTGAAGAMMQPGPI